MEIHNAVIESVSIDMGGRGLLTAWIHLKFDSGGQGFGGYTLYLPKSYKHHQKESKYAGHFIFRCMEIAGVETWEEMPGKNVRVKKSEYFGSIESIGHIIKDDWFNPKEEFKTLHPEKI